MSYLFLRPVWLDKEFKDRLWTDSNVTSALRKGVLNPGTILQRHLRAGNKPLNEYWMVSGHRDNPQELLPVHAKYIRKRKARGKITYSMCPHCKNKGAYSPVGSFGMRCKFCELEW